jgi:hypothetical protein
MAFSLKSLRTILKQQVLGLLQHLSAADLLLVIDEIIAKLSVKDIQKIIDKAQAVVNKFAPKRS